MERFASEEGDPAGAEEVRRHLGGKPSPLFTHTLVAWHLFFKPDSEGRSFIRRWEFAGLDGLRADERTLIKGKAQMRIAHLEIRRVIDAQAFEAVDLFQPELGTFVLLDESLAAQATRFSTLLTWIYPLPDFYRISGLGVPVPDWAHFGPEEIVAELVRHTGGPGAAADPRRWLAEHMRRFERALHAAIKARRHDALQGLPGTAVAAKLRGWFTRFDPALVPPRLREKPGSLDDFAGLLEPPNFGPTTEGQAVAELADIMRRWADTPISLIEDKSPRAAANDPRLRPIVVRLVKTQMRLHDERNLRTGRSDDINWLPRSLGLPELDVPPPPFNRMQAKGSSEDGSFEDLPESGAEETDPDGGWSFR